MLGKLGKFFRILGFDTKIASPNLSDTAILNECLADQRLLLTKDKEFYQRMQDSFYPNGTKGNTLYIDEPNLEFQVKFVFNNLNIDPTYFDADHPEKFLKRCSKCNESVFIIEKSKIKDFIEEGTYNSFNRFWICSNNKCESIFWIGSHWVNIKKTLNSVKDNIE